MRITMGSKELYPTDKKLKKGNENKTKLVIKLRLYGGARNINNNKQENKTSESNIQEMNTEEKIGDSEVATDNWDRLLIEYE